MKINLTVLFGFNWAVHRTTLFANLCVVTESVAEAALLSWCLLRVVQLVDFGVWPIAQKLFAKNYISLVIKYASWVLFVPPGI